MKRTFPLGKFINDQLSQWPLACDNTRALKTVQVKRMNIGGLDVSIQFNPSRIVSTSADVSEPSIRERRCFLCRENRPPEQISMKFEGRKSKKYDVLLNPYPIFPGHLVIASDRHVAQSIYKRFVDMLDLAKAFVTHTIFYNGPRCGASAPDHFHFQAAERGNMPLERDVDSMLDSVKDTAGEEIRFCESSGCALDYLTAVQDAELFHYRKFVLGIFVMRAATAKSAAKMFYRLLDCVPVSDTDNEPMFNLMTWCSGGEFRTVVIFRNAHRPHNYFSDGDDRLMVSPGCADMAGVVITPVREDFEKISPEMLAGIYGEVSMSEEAEEATLRRLVRKQPTLSVGIMSADTIEFEILSDGAGPRTARYENGRIGYDGALYDELYFEAQTPSMMFAEPAFVLYGVTIGRDFHWERKETQKFAGSLKIIVENGRLTAVNVVGVEDYLLSVISSEMKSTASEEFLKAHAVISRSWVMSAMFRRRNGGGGSAVSVLDGKDGPGEVSHIRWYGHDDHLNFDVCADDHCQRYQGLSRVVGGTARKVVDATWGQVLTYGGKVCDARFSKCCGGRTERFPTCWEDVDYPYLQSVEDSDDAGAFCNTSDAAVLSQVLNDYDLETRDFFEWTVEYGRKELSDLISRKTGVEIGELLALVPLERGDSGRISLMEIIGTGCSVKVGKELEIRKVLSESHLKSSAFNVEYLDPTGAGVPSDSVETSAGNYRKTGVLPSVQIDMIVLKGKGWGHGVGLCQIGAAVMAVKGYGYRDILSHYYKDAVISDISSDTGL